MKSVVSAVEQPPLNADDPTDNEEAKQLQDHKKNKTMKSNESPASATQAIAYDKYIKKFEQQCKTIKAEQIEGIRTEYKTFNSFLKFELIIKSMVCYSVC